MNYVKWPVRLLIGCVLLFCIFMFICPDTGIFFSVFKKKPASIGSLVPTSTRAATIIAEICETSFKSSRVILEIGAGTGPITEQIILHLRDGDIFYIVEAEPKFGEILRKKVSLWQQNYPGKQIVLFEGTLESFESQIGQNVLKDGFTHVISSLPFNSLPYKVVSHCVDFVKKYIRKDGIWSWVEYPLFGWLRERLSFGQSHCRIKAVRCLIKSMRKSYGATHRYCLLNFPPIAIYRIRFF